MELILIGSKFIRMLMVLIVTYYTFVKIIGSKQRDVYKTVFINLWCINLAFLYVILSQDFTATIVAIVIFLAYLLIICLCMKKEKIEAAVIAYIFSYTISYSIYLMATIISGIIMVFIFRVREYRNPTSLIIIPVITWLIAFILFKKKRFKNGFNFLNNIQHNKNVKRIGIFFVCIIIIIFCYPRKMNDVFLLLLLFVTVISVTVITVWIKSQITKTYKSKMRDRTIEIQKNEINEKNRILEEVKEENLKYATIIHKYNKKLSALEFEIKSKLEHETNTEFAEELAVILKETKETAENFAKETEIRLNKLPETNIPGIDIILKYMQEEAKMKNIHFDVKLNTNINNLLENTISKDKFETLIGDHLKDAIIAVEASTASYKSILVTLGLVEGIYELSIYDTGIEFEIETLLKLGEEQVTTHKETGGSGIGFMTTFETLKECKASLIIEEYNPETTSYTKSVTIRFDGKNKYKIYSYRANKIKEQKHKRRIIIEELK